MILLHCVSNYPAAAADIKVHAMLTPAGIWLASWLFGPHLVKKVSLASVALGACVVEKHFALDRSLPGPDHSASAEPEELRRLIAGIRTVAAVRWP
jgi:sialic acid synthase SpsE